MGNNTTAGPCGTQLRLNPILCQFTLTTDRIGMCQGATLVFWMILDTACIFYFPLRLAKIVCEGLML